MANETISELEPSPTPLNEKECEPPVALVSDGFLLLIWRANYWTAFMLSWLEKKNQKSKIKNQKIKKLNLIILKYLGQLHQ
mgnify:CR=1 FL=1